MRMRLVATAAAVAATAAVAVAVGVACNDVGTIVYSGRLFEPTRFCLDPFAAIDVVSGGNAAATCAPVCLVNGSSVYISTVCPPYPAAFDTTGTNPSCADALNAFARMDICLPDGGSQNPIGVDSGVVDAGSDAADGGGDGGDAGTDDGAGGDAGTDDGAGGDGGTDDSATDAPTTG